MGIQPISPTELDPKLQPIFHQYNSLSQNPEKLTFGNKHLCYYINGKLVGVGVVDVCPSIICSLYFFYDPVLKPLSFGKISVVKEIQLFQLLRNMSQLNKNQSSPSKLGDLFKYHNLGGFALGNGKVGYKAEFGPGQLLCPITMKYAEVGYIDRSLNEAIRRMESETNPEEIHHDGKIMDENWEEHVKTLEKLLFDNPNKPLSTRRLYSGQVGTLNESNEFGSIGYFGDKSLSAKKDLANYLAVNLKFLKNGKVVKAADLGNGQIDQLVEYYEWVFRAVGKDVIKNMLFKI